MKHLLDKLASEPRSAKALKAAGYLGTSLGLTFVIMLTCGGPTAASAQKRTSASPQKLPSAEKVVDSYLKTIGGKQRVATIKDATYEWTIQLKDQTMGIAKAQTKAPASARMEMLFGNGKVITTANPRSAWTQGLDGEFHKLTGPEASAAKLQAILDANHLLDTKKSNVRARAVSLKEFDAGPAYVVEFSVRSGARLRYLFSTKTKLLLSIEDDARKSVTRFEDYRAEGNILEPHRVSINTAGNGELTFLLQHVSYNTGISDSVFDPPRSVEAFLWLQLEFSARLVCSHRRP